MDYLFISGQVQAQESRLLNVNRLDRMIGATSPEAAFRVMSELQYAEYLDEKTSAKNFDAVITQGLLETKAMLINGTENSPGLSFCWLQFDLNNLKRALKRKFIEDKKDIGDFTEANGFSDLGRWDAETLQSIVFDQKPIGGIEPAFFEVIDKAEDILAKHDKSFRFIEYALDQAYFKVLSDIRDGWYEYFLSDLLALRADQTNFRNLARSVLVLKEKVLPEAWIPFGNFSYQEAASIETVEDFVAWSGKSTFGDMVKNMKEEANSENLLIIEKNLDKAYQQFLDASVMGEVTSIKIPFVYFEKRLQNARLLKFIMFAKFHGLSPEEIYKTLEKF